jgi:hypothetical protein
LYQKLVVWFFYKTIQTAIQSENFQKKLWNKRISIGTKNQLFILKYQLGYFLNYKVKPNWVFGNIAKPFWNRFSYASTKKNNTERWSFFTKINLKEMSFLQLVSNARGITNRTKLDLRLLCKKNHSILRHQLELPRTCWNEPGHSYWKCATESLF